MHEHPIEELIRTSRDQFEKTLAKQSRTLAEAVQEYRARTGMYPPPKFDIWYEFARSNNVQLIDEYDTIQDMLRPFWGVPPATIRQSIRDALGFEEHVDIGSLPAQIEGIFIRNGQVVEPKFNWKKKIVPRVLDFFNVAAMLKKFAHHLPDMDLLINH